MSKANDQRAERLARMQAQAAAKERQRRLLVAGAAVGVVVVIVVVLIVVKLAGGGSNNQASQKVSQKGSSTVVAAVTSVPAATFDAVGAGTAQPGFKVNTGAPHISASGKPKVLFVGAEFCPYCAATRWGLVAALSRFGTFSGVGLTASAGDDFAPNTPTLEFYQSSYTSQYVDFTPYETQTVERAPLQTLSGDDNATFTKYDAPPFTASDQAGAIPFIDFGGVYFNYGAPFDPRGLDGQTHINIAHAMHVASSPFAKAIDGSANWYTAAICAMTNQQPGNVCSSAGVQAAAAKLPKAS